MSKTRWIIFIVATLGVFGLLIVTSKSNQLDVSSIDANIVQVATSKNGNIADHVFGKIDSKVTLIEYGDFQCPGCSTEHTIIKAVTEEYKDQLQFIFRNFPLATIHPNAKAAAGTVETAGLQGKYWEMHNKIYETQSAWSNLTGIDRTIFFEGYATSLGLDIDKFKTDISSSAVTDKINYDYALGLKVGVNSTPSFFLNNKELKPEVWGDIAKLKDAINTELVNAGLTLPN